MRKFMTLLIIFLIIINFSTFSKSLTERFYAPDSPLTPYREKYGFILVDEEDKYNPKIVVNIRYPDNPYSISNPEGLNLVLKDLITIARIVDDSKRVAGEKYENIYVTFDYAFQANLVLDYKNTTLYIPKYYSDIAYLLNTYHTVNENQLLSNKESFDYLYYNGFLTSDKSSLEFMGYHQLDTGYKVYVVGGIFKSYEQEESKGIRINPDDPQIKDSDLINKVYKSYWGEGEWLVSKRYDDFSDDPTYEVTQFTSSLYDNANVWLNIRYTKKNNLEVYIDFSTNVRLSTPIYVTYRIDNKETKYDERWLPSTNRRGAFYPTNASNFVTELMDSSKVIFLVKSGNEQYKFEIDTFGLKKTLEPLLDTFMLR